jgi:hypothetical protein
MSTTCCTAAEKLKTHEADMPLSRTGPFTDSAWVDLDAIDAAVATQTMTGDYFVTMGVLGDLLTQ